MTSTTSTYLLPNLVGSFPIPGETNPHHETAGAESRAWINSYDIFSDTKRAYFIMGCNELLVSHTYPYAGYETFRTCCDFVNLLFVIDEITDVQKGTNARETGEIFVNAMVEPEWTDGSVLASLTKEFRARLFANAGANTTKRFLEHCKSYAHAVAVEAELRESQQILDLQSFITLRRENSAVRLCFDLIEYVLGIDLEDTVVNDPSFTDIYWAACDTVCWSNDIYSYNVEQSKGHKCNNVTTVLMNEKQIDLQAASDHIGEYCQALMRRFMGYSICDVSGSHVPPWEASIDLDVQRFFAGCGHWVQGNIDWSFETYRYFGADHNAIKSTRLVTLLPLESLEVQEDYGMEGRMWNPDKCTPPVL